jgi:alpha-2-macroglobulin
VCVDGLVHGREYKIEVRAGLPSMFVGEPLRKSAELSAYVKDRSATVRAAGKAYVLPVSGQQGIPLTTTNVELLGIEVYRIGDRGLAGLVTGGELGRTADRDDVGGVRERTGQKVYEGELVVPAKLNTEVTVAFPVSEALPKLQPGVYLLSAQVLPKKTRGNDARGHASQWFIVSDLGVTTYTGDDGVHAFVRSLNSALPADKVVVRLVAKNNEVLGTATTDARGYARFDAKLHKGEGGLAPALLTAETATGDYAFLDMASTAFDLSDRGVKGRNAPGPVDAYAYADRGVYRPGETVHLTALVRDPAAKALNVPVTVIVTRPDGVEHRRALVADQGLGGRVYGLALGGNAMGGTWRAKFYTDPKADPIAASSFLVEDFVPERMDLKLAAGSPSITTDGGMIKVAGTYLYGPPAADLAVEGEIVVRPAKAGLAAFPGYSFGLADEKIVNVRKPLEALPNTDAAGLASLAVQLPVIEKTARVLEADIIVKLREASGRTIERTVTLPVDLKQPRIGIKPSFSDGQAREGTPEKFSVVMVDGRGAAVEAKGLKWELVRLEQRWQWFGRGDNYNYEMQTLSRRVGTGTIDTTANLPAEIAAEMAWGRYRLDVKDASDTMVSNVIFRAGYYAEDAADSPEMLDVALDKPSYRSGDTARIKVATRFAGKALVTVMVGGVHTFQEAELPIGGGEIPLKVASDWGAGAYVTVTVFRPIDGTAKRMPGRAMGLRWLPIDQDARTLSVAIQAPDKVKPGAAVMVPVKITGLVAGEEARVTLAAVDVGILNLTRFEAPKPEGWFYGQRKLGLDVRDYYSRLIDGMRAEKGRLRSGGDGSDGDSMAAKGSAPVEATLALFSGIVKVDANGMAQVPLQLPEFNGSVRLSAVAWSADKVGSASKDMIVRDALALTVSGPRFMTLGDTARLQVDVHNVEGPASNYKLAVTLNPVAGLRDGPQSLAARDIALNAGEKKADNLQLKPTDIGTMPITVTVTGPDGIVVNRQLSFQVKPPSGDIRRVTISNLAASGGKVTISGDALTDLIPSSARVTVNVGPMASLDVASILMQLDRYPHGCAEQTTSRALPLLYVNDIAKQMGLGQDAELQARVQKAIERVFEMQDASGAFGIWGPADGDMWLTSYVTDFLLRAREMKLAVDARGLKLALDRLQNFISYAQDFEQGGENQAYALYVLARGGRTPVGELRYYIDSRLGRFTTPLALAHLGSAASLTGDAARAEMAFAQALTALDKAEPEAFRSDYGSNLRDRAAIITLASETRVAMTKVPQLVDVLAKAYIGKQHTTTQEQAWLLLAARSLNEQSKAATLTVNGVAHDGKFMRALSAADLTAGALTIANTATAATGAVVSVMGASLTTEPAMAKGIKVTRSYYTLAGTKVDLKSAEGGVSTLKQNDRLVVVLKVEAELQGGRILLVDRLPAGLEIENPRLLESGDIKTLDWLKTTRKPQHTEFKDDRFVAAFDFFGSDGRRGRRNSDDDDAAAAGATNEATVAYVVRAVTPGSFVHPAATVEDMYRPDRLARTAAGRLTVTGK